MLTRLEKTLKLYKKLDGCNIIVTGGNLNNNKYSETHLMKQWLVNNKVNIKHIIKENKSKHTQDNIYYSNKIINKLGKKILFLFHHQLIYLRLKNYHKHLFFIGSLIYLIF